MVLRDLGRQEYEPREFERQYVNLVDPEPWTPVPAPSAPITPELARRLARECQLCEDAPCTEVCPTSIDVLAFARKIEAGNYQGAVDTLRDVNPFSEVCGAICPSERLCEKVCTRGLQGVAAAVRIRDLHGWVCRHLDEAGGWQRPAVEPSAGRVAVVGAGPGGLTCAHYLARLGHRVDIFEKTGKPGGILSRAIPSFRLSEQTLEREINALTLPGMRFRFGEALGRDFGVADLERDYDAVFLAPGLGSGRRLALPGLEQANAIEALSWLEQLRAGERMEVGEEVVVIGGGSVASDAALCLREAGAARITVVCLESAEQMPALASEVAELQSRGIVIENGWGPRQLTSTSTIRFARCTRVFDEQGVFHPVLDDAETLELGFDQLVLAIGQELEPALARHLERQLGAKTPIEVDAKTLQVPGRPALFAGGDVIRGQGTAVEAVRDGRLAARAIDRRLRNT
jgi:NADPH-dependent glutamate synthase beta subunit-like oxidoreductase